MTFKIRSYYRKYLEATEFIYYRIRMIVNYIQQ